MLDLSIVYFYCRTLGQPLLSIYLVQSTVLLAAGLLFSPLISRWGVGAKTFFPTTTISFESRVFSIRCRHRIFRKCNVKYK